jgi:hypothetical protein
MTKGDAMKHRLLSVLIAVLAGLLAAPGSAQAVLTIGSNLTVQPITNTNCSGTPCTTANQSLSPSHTASGGLASPVAGVVVSWRAASLGAVANISLRILRPTGGPDSFTGVGTSAATTVAGMAIPTVLPIQIGDLLGLNVGSGSSGMVLGSAGAASQLYWTLPPLGDGETRAGSHGPVETLVQATIDPFSAFSFDRTARNKKNGTATVSLSVPNPGQLAYSGAGLNIAEKAASKPITAPGTVSFLIKAAGKKMKKLNSRGKVKVTPTFTFTPLGGNPNPESISIVLRKKR